MRSLLAAYIAIPNWLLFKEYAAASRADFVSEASYIRALSLRLPLKFIRCKRSVKSVTSEYIDANLNSS